MKPKSFLDWKQFYGAVALSLVVLATTTVRAEESVSPLRARIDLEQKRIFDTFGVEVANGSARIDESIDEAEYLNVLSRFYVEAQSRKLPKLVPPVTMVISTAPSKMHTHFMTLKKWNDPHHGRPIRQDYLLVRGPVSSGSLVGHFERLQRVQADPQLPAIYDAIFEIYNDLTSKGVLVRSMELMTLNLEEYQDKKGFLGHLTRQEVEEKIPPRHAKTFLHGLMNFANCVSAGTDARACVDISQFEDSAINFQWDLPNTSGVKSDDDALEELIQRTMKKRTLEAPAPADSNTNDSSSGQSVIDAPSERARH